MKPILKPPGGSYSILPEVVFMDEANPETSGRVLFILPEVVFMDEANPETSGRVLFILPEVVFMEKPILKPPGGF